MSFKKIYFVAAVFAVALLTCADAGFLLHGTGVPSSQTGWHPLLVGGGGKFTAIYATKDNIPYTRIDGPGAYSWNPSGTAPNGATGVWNTLVSTTSMPASLVANPQGFQGGVYEIKAQFVSPSNNFYMVYPMWTFNTGGAVMCGIYASTDGANTWSLTAGYSQLCSTTDWNGPTKLVNNRMDIDPTNVSNSFLGTVTNGLWYTRNGWATATQISNASVPFGSNEGVSSVLFDPANDNNLYVCSGGGGVYRSTNAVSVTPPTFTALSGGPTGCLQSDIDRANSNYYVISSDGQHLYRVTGTTPTLILTDTFSGTASINGLAVDPTTANHVIVCDAFGNLNETFNAQSATPTWGGWTNGHTGPSFSYTNDATWLATYQNNFGFHGIAFDRSNPLILKFNTDLAVFQQTLPGAITGSTNLTAVAMTRGVENLTTVHVLSVPTSPSTLWMSGWDFPIFKSSASTVNSYASAVAGQTGSNVFSGLCVAWGLDYAFGSTSFVATECDSVVYGSTTPPGFIQAQGFSSNAGAAWTPYTAKPTGNTNGGKNIAVSTTTNCMYAPTGGILPSFSNNCNVASPTWTQIGLPGSPSVGQFLTNLNDGSQQIAADRVNSGYFYLLNPNNGFYFSQNGATTWTAGATNTDIALTKHPIMKATTGIAQDVFVAGGDDATPGLQPQLGNLYHSIDGLATTCQIASMFNPISMGFGKAKSGNTFPAVYVIGWVADTSSTSMAMPSVGASVTFTLANGGAYYTNGTALSIFSGTSGSSSNTINGIVTGYNAGTKQVTLTVANVAGSGTFSSWGIYNWGVWRNDNFSHSTCNPGSVATGWQRAGAQYPLNSMQPPNDVDGDMNIEGQVYIALGVQGWAYYSP